MFPLNADAQFLHSVSILLQPLSSAFSFAALFTTFRNYLIISRRIDTGDGIQAARISDIGQAPGNHPHEEILIVAHLDIPFGTVSYTHLDVYKRQG